jgi:hypothetical protein
MVYNCLINKYTLRTFFRVYCDLPFRNSSILTNIPKFASAAPENRTLVLLKGLLNV